MQARYYDPVIGRFYSNDPVGYTAKNPVMSFNRYLYVNNNPYKYTDPNGEFLLLGALIGGGIDAAMQIGASMAKGEGFTEAVGNIDLGSVATSAALGAVGGFGAKLVQGAVTGTVKAGKAVVQLSSKTEKAVVGVKGSTYVAAAGGTKAGMNDQSMVKGGAIKVADAITIVPIATIIDNKDKIVDAVKEKLN